jgi:hypothetical protein
MNMRISIILMALALLVAYTIPAMSAECAQQGGQSCGKAEASCDCQGGNCPCNGECAEGCQCGCGGSCNEGQSCEGGSCDDNAVIVEIGESEPNSGGYMYEKRYGLDMGKRYRGRESYYLAEKRDLQRLIDEELKLGHYQKAMLAEASNDYTLRVIDLQQLYFDDRTISLEDLNHRLTLLNHGYDRHSRMMLTEFQDAVFPEHMWMIYSSPAWSKGYHPGSSYVLRELLKEYERDFEKRRSMRGEWPREWDE